MNRILKMAEKFNKLKEDISLENAEKYADELKKVAKKAQKEVPKVFKSEIGELEKKIKKEKKKLDKILLSIEKIKKEEVSSLVKNFVDGKGLKVSKKRKKKD